MDIGNKKKYAVYETFFSYNPSTKMILYINCFIWLFQSYGNAHIFIVNIISIFTCIALMTYHDHYYNTSFACVLEI